MFWLAAAVAVSVIVLALAPRPGPLDDPDPAKQRSGVLASASSSRTVERLRLPGVPLGRRPLFVVFDRVLPDRERLARLEQRLPRPLAVVVVVPGRAARPNAFPAPVVADPAGRIARAVGMRQPADGGPPIGYALVDARARVRYATLDPRYLERLDEAATMAGAIS